MENAIALAAEILEKREARLNSLASQSRQVCNRASSIGPCEREMYYEIHDWDKRPVPEAWLMARFQEGVDQERKVVRDLLDLGIEMEAGQSPIEIKDRKGRVILTGKIDGMIRYKGKKVPCEVKSLDPNIYNTLETAEDFNRYTWARKYPLQLLSYMYGHGYDEGIFIVTDCKGHWKILPMALDYAQMEEILQKCERVMDAIASGNAPDFIKDASVCRKCWALGRVCAPPLDFGPEMAVIDDPEIEVKLAKRQELQPQVKEYDTLDKELKAYFKGRPKSLCGDWQIMGTEQVRKMKATEAREIKSWVTKIEYLKGPAEEATE